MENEELERTQMIKTLIIEDIFDEDNSVKENIEEFEEKVEYMDIPKEKKEKILNLCTEIKKEENEKTQEYLLKLLQKEIN